MEAGSTLAIGEAVRQMLLNVPIYLSLEPDATTECAKQVPSNGRPWGNPKGVGTGERQSWQRKPTVAKKAAVMAPQKSPKPSRLGRTRKPLGGAM